MYTTLDTNAELQKQSEMTKAEIMAEIKEAFRYAKAVQDKKAEGRPVEELLNEL